MQNSLYPAFFEINYVSAFGAHKMRCPTVPYVAENGAQYDLRGAASPVPTGTAIGDFVDKIKPFFLNTTTFIDYTLFNMSAPDAVPQPVKSGSLNVAGTLSPDGKANKAVQMTTTFRTEGFGIFKLVFLDVPVVNFERVVSIADWTEMQALVTYVTADVSFLSGRDGERPTTFLQVSKTLNERLRRSYRMN